MNEKVEALKVEKEEVIADLAEVKKELAVKEKVFLLLEKKIDLPAEAEKK